MSDFAYSAGDQVALVVRPEVTGIVTRAFSPDTGMIRVRLDDRSTSEGRYPEEIQPYVAPFTEGEKVWIPAVVSCAEPDCDDEINLTILGLGDEDDDSMFVKMDRAHVLVRKVPA